MDFGLLSDTPIHAQFNCFVWKKLYKSGQLKGAEKHVSSLHKCKNKKKQSGIFVFYLSQNQLTIAALTDQPNKPCILNIIFDNLIIIKLKRKGDEANIYIQYWI